ncbi:MAG: hypothetical protein AUK47_20825 [Deltaproteobacteria bacterium CG2_30_63_29]|nr:MAG: hypothetical protein AUK47_20825 [Deltaproteobacteria bacterium CG2_30_63_29]PIW00958.1 MAG: hypothetical protein COW42_06355 [Deltaproteobacteria bacterium CG17_big_fil_post_rev_8_21_14_2_50_63_7]PJB40540.1 MAG: hypothetical protein CO108_14550 [Deltaproteobacteria bacterium CG_4_9_14_3_um_filter_63_12]
MTEDAPKDGKRKSNVFVLKPQSTSKLRSLGLENPLVIGVIIVVFAAAMLVMLAADFAPKQDELTTEDIGKIASKDLKATKDFTYSRIDKVATERKRAELAAAVPQVYTWKVDIAENARRQIKQSFTFMREGIAQVRQQKEAELARLVPQVPLVRVSPKYTRTEVWGHAAASGLSGLGLIMSPILAVPSVDEAANTGVIEAAIDGWIVANKQEFANRLLNFVDDATYSMLQERRFSEEVEVVMLSLVETALEKQIVADLGMLSNQQVVLVTKQRGHESIERWTERNIDLIVDTRNVAREVDLQAQLLMASWDPAVKLRFSTLAKEFIKPNLVLDEDETTSLREDAQDSVADLVAQKHFKRGEIILDEGHPVQAEHLEIYRAMVGESTAPFVLWRVLGLGIFLSLILTLVWYLLRRDLLRRQRGRRDLVFIGVTLLTMTLVVRGGEVLLTTVADAWQSELGDLIIVMVPFAAGPLMLRLVQGGEKAIIFAVVLALIAGLAIELASIVVPYALISGIVGAVVLKHAKTRMEVLRAGFLVGVISSVCAVGIVMFQFNELRPWDLVLVTILAMSSGILSGFMVTIALPVVESVFGYTTDIKLLELANLEHPALKDLLLKAPGTYHHSMMVGSLNEAAADAIGAHSLLARVGAYYHDLGKTKNSQYFAENQNGDNPHNKLKPNMSALILKAHVKDGIEMARQHKLPEDMVDFIATHHGKSRIEYFYQRAKEQESPDIPEVRELDYRYPGPKPQSRETGICMIADSVEAAARSLTERDAPRLRLLVHKLINHKFADGQFDECDLTLKDLNAIGEAMLHILNAVYHHRPEYPDQKKEREKRERASKQKDSGSESDDEKVLPSNSLEKAVEAANQVASTPHVNGDSGPVAPGPSFTFSTKSGADPDAPVGRVRNEMSNSGEHQKLVLNKEETFD